MRTLRPMTNDSRVISVTPTPSTGLEMAHCLMFYEYEKPLDETWLETIDSLFALFEEEPVDVIGSVGERKVSGRYDRKRERLASELENACLEDELDIRFDSQHVAPEEEFFPCRMRIACSTSIGGIRQGVIAVRAAPNMALTQMVDVAAPLLFERIGKSYAHAFEFPAAYGPDFYLSSVGAVRSGESSTANADYQKRLTRWRDSTWHKRKRPSQGFLREVYPINFLVGEQLESKVNVQTLREYIDQVGDLRECEFCDGLYRWDVAENQLQEVRREFEDSGLVLSAVAT